MKRPLSSVEMIRQAAILLGELSEDVAFLGGAALALLITDQAAQAPRPTRDVDVLVNVASKLEYDQLEIRLRKKGFLNVLDGPICRFSHGDLIMDVMPSSQTVLGFGNSWYDQSLATAERIAIGSDIQVKVIGAPYFIATKLEAFASPTREDHGDFRASRDFEDVVALLDGRPALADEIRGAGGELHEFVRAQFLALSQSADFDEGISAHLANEGRMELIQRRLLDICR